VSYNSRIVSIRIDGELLDAVRERANAEGRSLSGEIVFILRERVRAQPPARPRRPITGWLAHLTPPNDLTGFKVDRKRASADLLRAVRRKARAK
jgi:hypothetical protein